MKSTLLIFVKTLFRVGVLAVVAAVLIGGTNYVSASDVAKTFRAGAFAIDVTPLELPVIVNGNMAEALADKIQDRLHARCLVLDDGTNQIAIAVVDNCMMPRDLLDEAKRLASAATGIPANRMLISATHTHSAPSVHPCLGSDADEKYSRFLPPQIAKGIAQAQQNLRPARIGWAIGRDEKNVACRRWLMRPGTAATNAFSGKQNDRATMHPGPANPNAIMPLGPVDPEVPVLSVQTKDGVPLAVLTNYAMHYVGAPAISADYFAVVCEKMTKLVGAKDDQQPAFVGLHSNGTSGDAWLMDYTKPRRQFDRFTVAEDVANAAFEAYQRIKYYDWVPLVMEETLLTLNVRVPTPDEVTKARAAIAPLAGAKPKKLEDIYARETILLSEMPPSRELKLQAIRIGELGIASIPNEVFGITGITIKQRSPLKPTFVIELANGCEGYIPPPEQHALGGYETWRARTSCLEEETASKITELLVAMLAKVRESRRDEALVGAK